MPELEDLFERFRTRGDVAALGLVFDRAAPELLELARHLAPDPAAAEDLVQATFLAAIERADRFDASRELAPWLVGILTNKAKLGRALRSREIDPSRLGEREREMADPALDAELREFVAALDSALARLPAKYRDVLERKLRGEKPEEIARALRREPGAVRVQLHRGLARLRRLLPAGLALGIGVPIGPRGLGAMRASVLKHASIATHGAGIVTSSFVVGGVVVSTKSVAAVVAAVVAVAGGLWWLSRGDSVSPEPAPMEVAARETESAPLKAESTRLEPTESERSAVGDSSSAARDAEPYGALAIEVAWHDATPAAGVELECTPLGESQPYNHVEALVTDAAGRAELARVREGDVRIKVDRVGPYGNYTATVQRGTTATRRIEIPRGVDVRGRVLDPDGHPVSGAIIWLGFSVQSPLSPAFEAIRSGGDGRFVIRSAHAGGSVLATATGFAPSIARSLRDVTPDAAGVVDVELVLRADGSALEGVVADAAGNPLPLALVAVHCTGEAKGESVDRGSFHRTRTDADGRYRLEGLPARGTRVFAAANGFAHASQLVTLEAARTARADFALGRGASLSGTVTDERGNLVAGAGISIEPAADPLFWSDLRMEWATSDASGRYRVDAIARGTFMARATRRGDLRHVVDDFEAQEGAELHWDVTFDDGLTISGRAEDPNGAPLVDWTVRAARRESISVVMPQAAVTDADGRFVLKNLLAYVHDVRLYAPGDSEHWFCAVVLRPPVSDLRLVADPTGAMTSFVYGRTVDARGSPLGGVRLTLRDERERSWMATSNSGDGRFRIGPTSAGDLRLSIQPQKRRSFEVAVAEVEPRETRDVGDVVVPDTSSVEIDIRRDDGASLDRPFIRLIDSNGWSSILNTEDGVTFRSNEPLYEGRYRIFPVSANAATVVQEIDVRSGETARAEVRLPVGMRKSVIVRPAADERTYGSIHMVVRDARGNVVVEDSAVLMDRREGGVTGLQAGFAFGRYTLEVTAPDGRRATLDFEVKPDDEPFKALTLDFPAG